MSETDEMWKTGTDTEEDTTKSKPETFNPARSTINISAQMLSEKQDKGGESRDIGTPINKASSNRSVPISLNRKGSRSTKSVMYMNSDPNRQSDQHSSSTQFDTDNYESPRKKKDYWDLDRVIREKLRGTLPDHINPNDYVEQTPEDDPGYTEKKYPETYSHIKLSKESIKNRHYKDLWSHSGPRRDKLHTHVYYRYQLHRNEAPWFLTIIHEFTRYWDWVVFSMTAATFFILTYVSIFAFFEAHLFRLVFAFDSIFLVDTFFRINLEMWRYRKQVPYMILISPYDLNTAFLDALSIFPFDRLYILFYGTDSLSILNRYDFFRYNRFLRFFRAFTFLDASENERRISERLHFFIKYSLMYVMFIQLCACLFFLLIGLSPIDIFMRMQPETYNTWLQDFDSKKPGFGNNDFDYYTLSLYFATSVVTTTGYGDMDASNAPEMVVSLVVMLIGAIVLRGLFSSRLTNLELKKDGTRFDLFHRVETIQEQLKELRAAPLFCNKVQEYYPLLWNFRSGVQEVPFFSILPRPMQEDIKQDFSQALFHKSPLFRGMDQAFLRAVASRVEVILYNPGMVLCNAGQFSMIMYYVLQGELRTTSSRRPNEEVSFQDVILRPGTVFGEMNLFFSYPHTRNIETHTCCQIIQIDKDEILAILQRFPEAMKNFRIRLQVKLKELHKYHESVGRPPACWVYASKDLLFFRGRHTRIPRNNFPVVFRRLTGLNQIVYKDFIDDSLYGLIVEMPCIDDIYYRDYTVAHLCSIVPNILVVQKTWVRAWVFIMMILSLVAAITKPYCHAFRVPQGFGHFVCDIAWEPRVSTVVFIIYFVDAYVEMINCVPCTGLYFKIIDGFRVQRKSYVFWVDIFGFTIAFVDNVIWPGNDFIQIVAILGVLYRIRRVNRYLDFLDNTKPKRVFYFRLIKTVLMLLYCSHWLACINYVMACPARNRQAIPICKDLTWFNSYEFTSYGFDLSVHHSVLADSAGFLLSFFYATATISTAGFGDFNSQEQAEMFVMIFFQLVSFYLLCYSAAILTSALSCVVRPRLLLENKLQTVNEFMKSSGFKEVLRERVTEHYALQGRLMNGVQLPPFTHHFMFDSPNYLQDDALLMEFVEHFNGVSLLTKLDTKLLVRIAKSVRRFIVPPNVILLRKGEVRRQMFIVAKGSVGFFHDDLDKPHMTLERSCHFGIRDLIIGEPSHYFVKSLSYAVLLEFDYNELLFIMTREPLLETLLYETKLSLSNHIANMASKLASHNIQLKERVPRRRSWILMPTKDKDIPGLTYDDYKTIYTNCKFGRISRFWLMDRVINPNGSFALIWTSFISMMSVMTLSLLLKESFMQLRTVKFRMLQYSLDVVSYIDLYLRFHWGFYTPEGLLVVHPLQTASHYLLDGTFFYDICFCFPVELILPAIGITNLLGTSGGVHWFSKFRWVRVGQIIRIPPVLRICHDVFKARSTVLLLMYALLTLALCTYLASFSAYIACPVDRSLWMEGDENRFNFCDSDSWAAKKDMIAVLGLGNRWIVGIYYVCQVILLIGYGDMITLREPELLLLIFMMFFGCVIIVCILADITAAEVDLENVRLGYLENMRRMEILMKRERVHPALQRGIMHHLTHTWDKSKGLQGKLFADLHPSLRNDLFDQYVGPMLSRVPLFKGIDENIMHRIGPTLEKYYFIKGERLARTESLETEMYIIVDGKVWITDENRRWAFSLKGGESFGEVSMVYGTKRTFNAFAGSGTVEVFVMKREDYIKLILRFPSFGVDLKRRLKNNNYNDLYTKLRKKVRPEPFEDEEIEFKTKKINKVLAIRNIYDSTFEQPARKSWFRRHIFDFGQLDTNLPILYFISLSDEKFKLFIHPSCSFFSMFLDVTAMICGMSACVGVLEGTFGDVHSRSILELPVVKYGKYVIELLMYGRIFVGFITPFRKVDQTYCQSHKAIAVMHATNIWGLPVEVIASFPVFFFVSSSSWTRWLPIIRVLRLIPFYRFQFHKEEDIRRSTLRQKVTISVFSFLLVAHFLACFFYSVSACRCEEEQFDLLSACSSVKKMCPNGGWTNAYISDHELNESNRSQVTETWRWYLRSLYWVVTTISTTGFGTITPHSIPEIMIGIICIFCGSFLLSVILSHFTSGISSMTQSYQEYFFQVNILNTYYKTIGLSRHKERRVNTFFLYYWQIMRGVPYHLTTTNLPISLKIDLCYSLYGAVLEDCRLFTVCINDVSFMRQLCTIVEHEYYTPGTNIATIGDTAIYLYIVYRGNVVSWGLKDDRFLINGAFNVSEAFGKHGVLIYDHFYTKNYRAETHVEVLTVSQDELIKLCVSFPAFGEWLENYAVNTIDIDEEHETIFEYQRRTNLENEGSVFSQQYIEAEQDDEVSSNSNSTAPTITPRRPSGIVRRTKVRLSNRRY